MTAKQLSWFDSFACGDISIDGHVDHIIEKLIQLTIPQRVAQLNFIRKRLHEVSPFKNEPVDYVEWVPAELVKSNDYNPNKVAPPEMELLEISITNDGYTQPIVTWPQCNHIEVVDGFHRSRVGKESKVVSERVNGYLPTVSIRSEQTGKSDRIASTIRHNRARGKHQIDAMSEIVIELKNRNWTNSRVARELGMDEDEVLRLCQITGLGQLFSDADFSRAWESSDSIGGFEELTDDITDEDAEMFRTINTDNPNRTFHTYDKWECHVAGFYSTKKDGWSEDQCLDEYVVVLSNQILFASILEKIITEWKHSCEHYLTNPSMNRIAWMGQAAVCYHSGVPSKFSAGWNRLTEADQNSANETAFMYLNKWLVSNGLPAVEMHEALSIGRQVNIY